MMKEAQTVFLGGYNPRGVVTSDSCHASDIPKKEENSVNHIELNEKILGDWKGFIGCNNVKIRFEITNQTNKILAWCSICTHDAVNGRAETPEMISTKVRYNYLTGDLLIEDMSLGPIFGWVTSNSIIGNVPTGNVILMR